MTNPNWHPDELRYVSDHYLTKSDVELGVDLGRSSGAVGCQRSKLGLFRARRKPESRSSQLAEHWGKIHPREIGLMFKMSEARVRDLASKTGLGASGFKKSQYDGQNHIAKPVKPKGMTSDQIGWAKEITGLNGAEYRLMDYPPPYGPGCPAMAREPILILMMARDKAIVVAEK